MITFFVVIFVLALHYVADFILQTPWQAENKSKNFEALLGHVLNYSIIMGLGYTFLYPVLFGAYENLFYFMFSFIGATMYVFYTHFFVDLITSRFTRKYFKAGNWHMGFVIVGLDQLIHYITLFTPIFLLTK